MTKAFTPKVPRAFGRIERQLLTPAQLCSLFTNPKYMYAGQRGHEKGLKNRAHVRGALIGNAQQFAGAYCDELKSYVNIDGYHRAHGVAAGLSFFLPGYDIELSVFRVNTVAELDRLYDQYNSAAAAKKSNCYFESGLRDAQLTGELKSKWVLGKGRCTAVQMASAITGTAATRKAVVHMRKGLLICDGLNLPTTDHIFTGVKGALLAIAQYSPDEDLAKLFIKNVCESSFEPTRPTLAETVVLAYREQLMRNGFGGKTGIGATTRAFNGTLAVFAKVLALRKRQVQPKESSMTLPEFIVKMQAAGYKAA